MALIGQWTDWLWVHLRISHYYNPAPFVALSCPNEDISAKIVYALAYFLDGKVFNFFLDNCTLQLMLDHRSSTPKLLFTILWSFVWSWSNFNIILFKVPQFTVWSFRDGYTNLLRCRSRRIKNAPLDIPYLLILVMLWSHDLVMS